MKLSHAAAFAFTVLISTGSLVGSSHAGFLKDVAGAVGSKVQNRGSGNHAGPNYGGAAEYVLKKSKCVAYYNKEMGAQADSYRSKIDSQCHRVAGGR